VNELYALQPVTQRLLDDASFDIGKWVEGKIADKFARSEGTAMVTGNGIGRPRGFLAVPTDVADDGTRAWGKLQYVVSGAAASIVADALRNQYWALRAPHRKNATWLMASATANLVDKLKDSAGDYLWRNGMTSGAPPSLLGRPVEFDENMPAVGAGTFPIAFGDWLRGYLIVDKAGIKTLHDPYTSKPNVLFYAYRRIGGDVANYDAIKLMKISE
jgi:HK97 family phage major capsid protein